MLSQRSFFTTEELEALPPGQAFVSDVESFPNYFLAAFKHVATGKYAYFEAIGDEPIAVNWLYWFMSQHCIIGFNFLAYDAPVIGIAMTGQYVAADLKRATNRIIVDGVRHQDVQKEFGSALPSSVNIVDVMEVAPLAGSLKVYGARLHCKHLQDLPYHPDTVLTREEITIVRNYCFNDLDTTESLANFLTPHLELRYELSKKYGTDMRSLSDAQMAQVIIVNELEAVAGRKIKRPDFRKLVGTQFRYKAPDYVKFNDPSLAELLDQIQKADIEIGPTGHVICPPQLERYKVVIDGRAYTIGMGGLHSNEKRQALIRSDDLLVMDRDVSGYYPNLILKNKFAPDHLGEVFLVTLQGNVDRRDYAKINGPESEAGGLKIANNGTFGKLSDPYSPIYSPPAMVQTTITGQLSLIMAISWLTQAGFKVVSANTDGIVTMVPANRVSEFQSLFGYWEEVSGLKTEETEYKGLFSKDVNNYVAVKMNGKHKAKGIYSEFGSAHNSPLSKNPTHFVTMDAVVAKLSAGVPIEETIRACSDIRRFVTAVKVDGGAQKDGRFLGKVVRWYYATGQVGSINRCDSGNKVSLSDGGKPCMVLPDSLPADIDFARYVEISTKTLEDIGFQRRRNEQLSLLT